MLHSPNQWRGLRESKNKVHPQTNNEQKQAHKSFNQQLNHLTTIQNGQNKANRT